MNPGLLVGAGFLLGSVGVKALTSNKAKQVYVKGIVQGMRAKEEVQTMVDEARVEFDDLLAEAGYTKELEDGEQGGAETASHNEDEGESSDDEDDKSARKTSKASSVIDEAAKQAKKAAARASKVGVGKGVGHGGRGHGHGRARK